MRAQQRPWPPRDAIRFLLLAVVASSVMCTGIAPDGPRDEEGASGNPGSESRVTTVRSATAAWGASARLVEESSIGVDRGPDEYMFGDIRSLYATEQAIYVVDGQVPAVRVFDFNGQYVRDLGAVGQGPGEFLRPGFITGGPDGRLVLQDENRRELMNVYGGDGEVLEPYRVAAEPSCCTRPMVVTEDGSLWLELRRGTGRTIGLRSIQRFVQRFGREGSIEELRPVPLPDYEPLTFRLVDIDLEHLAPFSPEHVWALSPDGSIIVGISSEYEFEIHRADGSIIRVVRETPPVAVLGIEAEWHRKAILSSYGWTPGGSRVNLDWNEEIPETKPAYTRFVPAASGEIWVYREGPAAIIADCSVGLGGRSGLSRIPPACHETTYVVDVFDSSGGYLGEVDLPDGFRLVVPLPFVRDDVVVAVVEDASGLQKVKRYRLVPSARRGAD